MAGGTDEAVLWSMTLSASQASWSARGCGQPIAVVASAPTTRRPASRRAAPLIVLQPALALILPARNVSEIFVALTRGRWWPPSVTEVDTNVRPAGRRADLAAPDWPHPASIDSPPSASAEPSAANQPAPRTMTVRRTHHGAGSGRCQDFSLRRKALRVRVLMTGMRRCPPSSKVTTLRQPDAHRQQVPLAPVSGIS